MSADARPPTTLDHCVVHVSDWERCNRFYRDVIGAEIVPVRQGFAYRFANAQLNLHGPGQIGTPRAEKPVELGPVERFGARGPGTSVYFRDPDGSLMEFISYE